ncbi:MAG: Ig-like domain-containing protein [Ignavibacteria bacterium]
MIKHIHKILSAVLLICAISGFSGCANQQPPSGGEDDKVPPRIKYLYPRPNTVNFSGNEITLEFDEYVDRRSFIDAFFVTPKPKGTLSYDWSGKEVTVEFEKGLEKNKTYLFVIGKVFKDVRNNPIGSPIQFAISTGPAIDKGKISGKVFGENFDRTFVFAYKQKPGEENNIDPEKNPPDYIMPVSTDGSYSFENLSAGKYRLFTVFDGDLNGLYDKVFERISIAEKDAEVSDISAQTGINFILKDVLVQEDYFSSKGFLNGLQTDSAGAVFSSVLRGEMNAGLKSKLYLYFKNRETPKEYITQKLSLKDTLGKEIKYVFNWQNDSLLEVSPTTGIYYGAAVNLSLEYVKNKQPHEFSVKFTIAEEKKFGEITGVIQDRYMIEYPVVLKLIKKDKPEISFTRFLTSDSLFSFTDVLEGGYYLIAYVDKDNNGKYETGQVFPFRPAERIFLYGQVLNLKGSWKIEKVSVVLSE